MPRRWVTEADQPQVREWAAGVWQKRAVLQYQWEKTLTQEYAAFQAGPVPVRVSIVPCLKSHFLVL